MALFSGSVFAVPIKVIIPLTIARLPPALFTSVQITGYRVDGRTIPIPRAPALTQGESYATPLLELGDRSVQDEFQFRLLGGIRARNSVPGQDNVIVPFRVRYTVRLAQIGASVVGSITTIEDRVETEHIQGGIPLAHHIQTVSIPLQESPVFNNNGRLNIPVEVGFTANNVNAAVPLLLPDLLSQ
ncbi:hypothetical protein [Dyella choica]|uniref:Uncharacterized protein n=1 Tax=Dyella choica TaxID=1927959 RepID=A0A3S0S0J2_9GAMM|nr:hypothetical protein [Dyella choica]RUL76038.1 hypothetical protein EKH80_09985 [Dyella choica]